MAVAHCKNALLAIGVPLWRRKFRTFIFIVLFMIVGVVNWWCLHSPLTEFVDRDLRKLDDSSQAKWRQFVAKFLPQEFVSPKLRLQKTLQRILPGEYTSPIPGFEPRRLWRYNDDSEPQFLLLLAQHRGVVPGESRAAVHFLGSTGEPWGYSDFSISNCDVVDAAFRWEPKVNERVIELWVSHPGYSLPTRLVYGVCDDRVALIRVEDRNGETAPSSTMSRSLFGPMPPHRSASECEEQLGSDRPSTVLEALSSMYLFDHGLVLVDDLRYTPSLRERTTELCRSDNPWIREAAASALFELNKFP
jgi:hypothetical protein